MNSAPKPRPTMATRIFLSLAMKGFLGKPRSGGGSERLWNCMQNSRRTEQRQGAGVVWLRQDAPFRQREVIADRFLDRCHCCACDAPKPLAQSALVQRANLFRDDARG